MNHKTTFRPCICLGVLLAHACVVTAVSGQPPVDPITAALDANQDGELSAEEIEAAVESLSRVDKNKDGKLTLDELMPEFPFGFGRGGPRMEKRKLVADFDEDGDGRLSREERDAARASLNESGDRGGGRRPPFGGGHEPAGPGPTVDPKDVANYPAADLYDPTVLRTIFLEFEHDDWEKEMADFKDSDVEVPATLRVDGKVYPQVGVHFRGMSSFMMVQDGQKRPLNISLDYVDKKQDLYGSRTLNLLNSNGDPSMMSSLLYHEIGRHYMPIPAANYVQLVINGESWGVYVNSQQFNNDFIKQHFGTRKGSRWKVRGNPGGDAGMRYFGVELDEYKKRFQIKSKDSKKAWERMISLCRILEETPVDKLRAELDGVIDVDELLWFLALDVALVNSDGYWTRASDYSLYLDENDRFHLFPHDINEAFHGSHSGGPFGPPRGRPDGPPPGFGPLPGFELPPDFQPPPEFGRRGGGPGGRRGRPNHGGFDLDPLENVDDSRMPLRSKVLAVPELRTQYLQNVKEIADHLSWDRVGPVVLGLRELISEPVRTDTKKLYSHDEFLEATTAEIDENTAEGLRHFFEARRKYLLEHEAITALPPRSEGLVINEVVPHGNAESGDWIELFNDSSEATDLSNTALSDSAKNVAKWTFPAGAEIGAHEYLVIWADDQDSGEGLHANFRLSKKGETLYLSRKEGDRRVVIDTFRYGASAAGLSMGRTSTASASSIAMEPTPGQRNVDTIDW